MIVTSWQAQCKRVMHAGMSHQLALPFHVDFILLANTLSHMLRKSRFLTCHNTWLLDRASTISRLMSKKSFTRHSE